MGLHQQVENVTPDTSETWRTIDGFSRYEVSSLGRVRRGVRVLRQFAADRHGSMGVDLRRSGANHRRMVRLLVAAAFVPQTRRGTLCAHLNDDYSDCRAVNLAWLTPAELTAGAHSHRRRADDGTFAAAVVEGMEAAAVLDSITNPWT